MKKTLITFIFTTLAFTSFAQWKDGGTKITTTQNVGIGTEDPAYKLDIVGDTRSKNLILTSEGRVTGKINDNFTYQTKSMGHYALGWFSDTWTTDGGSLWQSGYGGIKFFTRGLYRMGISKEGNVGIGTENPAYKLDVNGEIRTIAGLRIGSYTNTENKTYLRALLPYKINESQAILSFDFGNTVAAKISAELTSNGSNLVLGTSNTGSAINRMTINHAGNVGIGTENPAYKLDVNGEIRTIAGLRIGSYTNTENKTYLRALLPYKINESQAILSFDFGNTVAAKISAELTSNGSNLVLGTSNTGSAINRMTINHAGNVGIGTETPTQKLDVVGNIKANGAYINGIVYTNEVKVEATTWADLVFDKDYKLPALSEVENHINEHKHLPNIPSEAEVKENGVGLGEMQARLLQKIEELTLYVIDLKKENTEQGKKIEELQSKLEGK